MYKDGPHTIRVKIFIMGVDPYRVSARVGSDPPPSSTQHQRGGIHPCWQRKLKYIPYFAVISVEIGHFGH